MKVPSNSVIRTESETVVGEDQHGIPIVECPEMVIGKGYGDRGWSECKECGEQVWRDIGGTFYHKLSCSKSNGIGYGKEKTKNTTLPHSPQCQCNYCESPKK